MSGLMLDAPECETVIVIFERSDGDIEWNKYKLDDGGVIEVDDSTDALKVLEQLADEHKLPFEPKSIIG